MIVWHTTEGTFTGTDQRAIVSQFGPGAAYQADYDLLPEARGRITTDYGWVTVALVLATEGPEPSAEQVSRALEKASPLVRPVLEVEATHVCGSLRKPNFACELYPGVIVRNPHGIYSVLTAAHLFDPIPPEHAGTTFIVSAFQAELAAEMYDQSAEYAERSLDYAHLVSDGYWQGHWPPPRWVSRSKYTELRSGGPLGIHHDRP